MEEQIKGFEEICCAFNDINNGLAGLIGAALSKAFAKKSKQKQSGAVQAANEAAPGKPPELPPEGFYSPTPLCSTEELIGEVLGGTINKITSTFASAKNRVVSTANDGTNPDIATASGSSPTQSVDMSISQSNVTESLKSGSLVGGMTGALAAAAGVNVDMIGSVASAFKSGNYASGLSSMLSLSGISADSGVATAAIHAISSGDLVGGFTEAASALGVPAGMMSNMGGAFSAIQSGDMSALTGQIQNLASFDPQAMFGSVAGLSPGDLIGGGGALGGMNIDIASSMNFTQSLTQFFECDDEVECSPNDVHTLDGGGESVDGSSSASIDESANNAAKTPELPSLPSISEVTPPSFKKPEDFVGGGLGTINPLESSSLGSGSLEELANLSSTPIPRDPDYTVRRGVLDSMGDFKAGTSVHDMPGGPETYWNKLEQERPLTSHEKRWRDKGRDQYGYTKTGNEQKKTDFKNNIFR